MGELANLAERDFRRTVRGEYSHASR